MEWLLEMNINLCLVVAFSSWTYAQVIKTIIHAIINKKLDLERLVGDGGMPSAHSATVTSLATYIGLTEGFGSPIFALALIFAMIVCHDAMGVRREAGKHAILLIEISKAFEEVAKEELPELRLKEFVGHSPIQVGAGIILGIANAGFIYWLMFL
jgi:acid phosphatase family membrane protein YuiD